MLWAVLVVVLGQASAALAYIDRAPTLGRTLRDAINIALVEVEKVSPTAQVIVFKKIEDLKGSGTPDILRQRISDGFPPQDPRPILDWATPGARAVFFHSGRNGIMCLGAQWYECATVGDGAWQLTRVAPERLLGYCGSVQRLRAAVSALREGQPATITVLAHGVSGVGAFFEVGMKGGVRGNAAPVQRVKVAANMPGNVWEMDRDRSSVVGPGPVGLEDVPGLIAALKDADRWARMQAADDLASLTEPGPEAITGLTAALADTDAVVTVHAGAALARLRPSDPRGLNTLRQTLRSLEAPTRAAAASAAGDLGSNAKILVGKLIAAVGDSDLAVRRAAAAALGEMGPDAAEATRDLKSMLHDAAVHVAAADALGGIGAKAQAAVPALTELLKDKDDVTRWAAARALARIGTPGTRVAVPVITEFMGKGEMAYYNGTLVLAAMGPEAREALPLLAKRNDDLSSFARWAIDPHHPPSSFFNGSLGHEGMPYEGWWARAHMKALGPTRRSEAVVGVVDGLASGQFTGVEGWGLELLRDQPAAAVKLLTKGLEHKDVAVRQRMADTLGRMGQSAAAGVPALTRAQQDADQKVAKAAKEALRKIQGA